MSHSSSRRASVLVVATGGTIGMHETDSGLSADPGFPDALERMVVEICRPLRLGWRINHVQPPIDSANADEDTAPRIARAVSARVRAQRPRGVVILHGTDSLAFTAARLAFELADLDAPVVLTGSMLPHGAAGSDAKDNLSLAIRASVKASPSAPVAIAFGGRLLPAVRATKHSSDDLDGFRAHLPLADSAIGIPDAVSTSAGTPLRLARTVSFRFVPGVVAEDVRAIAASDPDGVVIESYGAGNAPVGKPGVEDALRDLAASRPVAAISQCATGGIDLGRYAVGRGFAASGVLDGGDLTIEAATAKLGYLLDQGIRGEDFRTLFSANLIGERTV